jgi:hypothetical protein
MNLENVGMWKVRVENDNVVIYIFNYHFFSTSLSLISTFITFNTLILGLRSKIFFEFASDPFHRRIEIPKF